MIRHSMQLKSKVCGDCISITVQKLDTVSTLYRNKQNIYFHILNDFL